MLFDIIIYQDIIIDIMFEKIVQKILSPILSEYVEDFNAQNMKIGLWSGEVVIKNVQLKKDIIKKLNLPFKLKYSMLGCLRMTIPWKSIGSSKIDIVIEGLELLITQVPQNMWECKNTKIIEKRKQQLMTYCESIISDFTKKSTNASKQEQQKGYFGGMVVKIIDNIQVTIKDIHIRYEDQITQKYSFGITLQELRVYTVNKNGQPQFVDRTKKEFQNQPLRKKLILSNLGIYWNERSQFYRDVVPHSDMQSNIARSNQPPNPKMNYLILMSSNALLHQRQAGKQYVQPQINLFISFQELKVKISNLQLQQIVTLSQRLQSYMNQVKLQNRKKLTQLQMIANHKQFTRIFPNYYQKKSSAQQNNKIESILQKMQIQNFKDAVKSYIQSKQKQKLVKQKMDKNKGWFSKPKQLTEQQMKQIQKFMNDNFGLDINVVKRPEDFYYVRVNFNLKLLNVTIANTKIKGKNQEGLTVSLQDINMDFNLREGGYKLNFGIDDIGIDIYSMNPQKKQVQSMTRFLKKMPEQGATKKIGKYVQLQVIGNPLQKKNLDTQLSLTTQELLVQFDPRLIKIAKDFADIKINSQNTQAALEAYGDIKNKVSTAAASAAESIGKTEKKKNFLSLDIKISSINLLLFYDPMNLNGDLWAINLGEMKIFSDPKALEKPEFAPDEPMQKYCMTASKISMAHFQNKDSYFYLKSQNQQPNQREILLNQLGVDFQIQMFQKSTTSIPSIRATATLHNVDLNLSSSTYSSLQKIGNCFSLPEKVEVEAKQELEKIKANQKAEIMKHTKKIGMVYEQSSKQIKKYIGVISQGYLYLYQDKKDNQYTTYYYIRNSKLSQVKQTDITKKPISLVVQNSVNTMKLGFDKESAAEEWAKVIRSLETENQFVIKQAVDQGEKIEEQPKKPAPVVVDPNNLNIEVLTKIERISVRTLLHADRKVQIKILSLSAHAKMHQTKTVVKVSLKQISIADNIYNYKYKELTNFLYSQAIEGKQKLIDINLELLNEKNSDYADVDTSVSVEVGKLVCNYKPETVQNLMRFLIPKSQPVPVSSKQLTLQNKKSSLDSHHEDSTIQQQTKKRKLQKQASLKSQPQKYSIQLKLVVQQISIALVNRKSRTMFAKIGMDKFRLSFGQSNKKMMIYGGIGELWLSDYSNYPNTIIKEQEQYTKFQYIVETFNKSTDMITFDVVIMEYANQNGKTMIVKAGLYDLSASYNQQPVLRLITYLTEQLLPSLTPSSQQSKPRQPPIMLDTKPEPATMQLVVDLQNVLAVIKPRNNEQESLELLIKTITVRNSSVYKPYIKEPVSEQEKVLTQIYTIKLSGLSITQRFKNSQNKLTNDLNIDLQCQLIQNTLYYVKTYQKRYQPGMRILCKLSPFLMKISHADYNFIMKCLFWNITYDDNAEGYLFDPALKAINKETQAEHTEPMYCNVLMDRIVLAVCERDVPVSVLFLGGLGLNLSLSQDGMRLVFQMKNLFGIHVHQTLQQNVSVQKGIFNLFGYQRKINTKDLLKIDSLIDIYSVQRISESTKDLNIQVDPTKPIIYVQFETNKFSDTFINVKIQNLKIAIQLKNLLMLSKLVVMQGDIQPPKSTLPPVEKKKVETPPPNSGKTVISIEMTNFLGSLSDKTGKNYVVLQGQFFIKLKMNASKTEDQVIAKYNQIQNKESNFFDVALHNIELRNFSLYFCNLNNLKNKRYILNPMKLMVIYSQQYRMVQKLICLQSDIDVQLEKVIVECSVRDMIMINKIIQDNMEALAQNSKDKKQIKSGEDNKIEKKQDIKSEISQIRDTNFEIDKKSVQKTIKQIQKKIIERTRADVKMQPVQIRIVNDCNNNFMPVLNFIIQESTIFFTSHAIKSSLSSTIIIKLDFFNPRSASWQPVIQNFKLSIDYLVTIFDYGPKTNIIISSVEIQEFRQLKLNASTQLVSSLLATIDIAKSESQKIQLTQNVNQIEVSPYIIENQTNKPIKIQRIIQDSNNDIQIKPLFRGPVKLTDKAQDLAFWYEGKRYVISLDKFGIVGVEGLYDVHLSFKMEKLNRVLCFVNKFTIKNATFSKIYCIRYNENKQKVEQSILMQPDQIVPLQKNWYVQFSFNMNSFTSIKQAAELPTIQQLRSQTQKFKFSINQKRLIGGHTVCIIRAPFVILNCLPKNMDIQFISGGKQVSSKQIPAQGSHEVFANDDIGNLRFKILCEGFYWSQQFWSQENFLGKESLLYLSDRENGGSSIKYIFERDERRLQYRLNVFCPAFIVSELDSDLQIYTNLQNDETNRSLQKYYKLAGQTQFWRKDAQSQQQRSIDKRTLIGTECGSKIRVCGRNCLVDFSQPISIKNIGVSQTRVAIETNVRGKNVCLFTVLGVDVSLKKMALKADIYTRQITLRYRWIFYNNSPHKLMVKEQNGQRFYYQIDKSEKKPFYFIVPEAKEKPKGLIFKTEDTLQGLPVIMNDLGSIYFRLQKKQQPQTYLYFKLNVQQIESYLFYQLTQVDYMHLPYQIVVKSDKLQAMVPLFNDKYLQKDGNPVLFINQIPHQPYNLTMNIRLKGKYQSQQMTAEADNLNFRKKLKFYGENGQQLTAVVYVIFNDSKKYIVIDQQNTDPQQIPEYELFGLNFKLQRLSLSIIQNHAEVEQSYESFYFYMQNLQFVTIKTNKTSKHQVKLQFIQFDQDQPYNIPNPVILTPAKYKQFTSLNAQDKPKSIFNGYVQIDNTFVKNMFFNKIVIEINDIVIKIGSPFIKLIMQIYKEYMAAAKGEAQYAIKNQINTWKEITPPVEGSKTFIKSICIAPFTINISAQIRLNELDSQSVVIFGTILNALGVVITNIQDAPVFLAGIILNDCTDTMQGINNKLIAHYKSSVLKQLYKIFGSLNIIGNPVSLFRNISTGIKDLKDKPAEGFVEGPLEFGKGLAQGTTSLIAHSVGGALNSVEKVTGAVATGLAALTFDKQFQERRERQKMKKPKHVLQGLEKGGKAVFRGFKEGLTGVVLKPYQNAQKQGALGFLKGVGQGITGLVVKPVTGVIDFASKTTQGLKNTALYLEDKPNENRIRYPRVLYTEIGILKQYNEVDSKLQSIIKKNKYEQKYKLNNDFFVESFRVGSQSFLVIMQSAVVLVNINENTIDWGVPLRQMKFSRSDEKRVRIEGPPKSQQFWQKSVGQNVQFQSKEEAEKFEKTITELKTSKQQY